MAYDFDPFEALERATRAMTRGAPDQRQRAAAEAAVRAQEETELQAARDDVNVFMRLVFKNDQDPDLAPFEQQWFHREWQRLWSTARVSVLHGATGYGKTEQLIGHLLWRLGHNPRLRILLIGKKEDNASKLLQKIKRLIESSATVRRIFPALTPAAPWSTEKLRLAEAGTDITTNNVEVYGLDGSPQGARADIIVLDDVIDGENTATEEQREKVITFVDSVVQSRLTTHGQLHILANAWHKDDLAFVYSKRPGIEYGCYPAKSDTGELLWPSFRPQAWLDAKAATMHPRQFARMFLCKVTGDDVKLFEPAWFTLAHQKGAGQKPLRTVEHALHHDGTLRRAADIDRLGQLLQQEMRVVVALDLATREKMRKRKSDLTFFWVVGLYPSGLRRVLWAEGGRWTAPVILEKMAEYEARYKPNRFIVESNAAQVYLAQFAQAFGDFEAAIDEFITSGLKWDEALGIEEIGVEMKAGRWAIPGPAAGEHEDQYRARLTPEELAAYVAIQGGCQHLLDFSRQGHTPDDVMSWYFAKEGVKRMLTGVFSSRDRQPTAEDEARAQASTLGTARALGLAVPPLPAPSLLDDATAIPDAARRLLGL